MESFIDSIKLLAFNTSIATNLFCYCKVWEIGVESFLGFEICFLQFSLIWASQETAACFFHQYIAMSEIHHKDWNLWIIVRSISFLTIYLLLFKGIQVILTLKVYFQFGIFWVSRYDFSNLAQFEPLKRLRHAGTATQSVEHKQKWKTCLSNKQANRQANKLTRKQARKQANKQTN